MVLCEYCGLVIRGKGKKDFFGRSYHVRHYRILLMNDPYFGSTERRK